MSSSILTGESPSTRSGLPRLSGHVAVVTGAVNGIGRAFATRLAAEGAAVAVVDLVASAGTVQDIAGAEGTAVPFVADVSDPEQVAGLVGPIEEALGRVDILVNTPASTHGLPSRSSPSSSGATSLR